DAENLLASLEVGRAHRHLAIEAAGTKERGIQNIRPVGGRDDDDALVLGEAIHLDEQLIEGLFPLLVAQRVAAATAAYRVELVDEHDAGGMTPRVLEQAADARRADAGVHLDEI